MRRSNIHGAGSALFMARLLQQPLRCGVWPWRFRETLAGSGSGEEVLLSCRARAAPFAKAGKLTFPRPLHNTPRALPTAFRKDAFWLGWSARIRIRDCRVHQLSPPRLVFKAHRLFYHSTLGLRVIKKMKRRQFSLEDCDVAAVPRNGAVDTDLTS